MDERPGVKFNDAELIGIPIKVICGRSFHEGIVEFEHQGVKKDMPLSELATEIKRIQQL